MKDRRPHSDMNDDHRAIVDLLEKKGSEGASTTEIVAAGYNGYRGRISELRLNFDPPIAIVCRYDGTTEEGRKMHRYFLPQYAPDAAPEKRPEPPRVAPDTQSVVPADKVPSQTLCLPCLGRFVTGATFYGTCQKCGRTGKVTTA